MENFPIYRKKVTYAECSNSCDFGIKNFFLELSESGKFSTKVENFPLPLFGLKFGILEGPDAKNKISPKWKIFHQKWKKKSDFKFEICWFLWPKKVLWSCSKFAQMMFTIDKCAPFSTFVTSSFLLEENPISSLKFWKIWFKNPLEERPFFQ